MDERELQEIEAMQAAGGVLPGDVGRLVAEVRRLRARAVPAVVWDGEKAVCGNFLLGASGHEWLIGLALNGKLYMLREGKTGGKPACEAAFLRLVGCK